MIIRKIKSNDYDEFMKLIQQINNKIIKDKKKFIDYILTLNSDSKFIFVLEINEEIIGTCSIFIEKKIINNYGIVCHLEDFVIDKEKRGMNYGSILLKEMIKIAKDLNCYKIILNCYEDVKKFYQKNGFEFKQLQGSIYF